MKNVFFSYAAGRPVVGAEQMTKPPNQTNTTKQTLSKELYMGKELPYFGNIHAV